MKIHFDASGRGFKKYGHFYLQIEQLIKKQGHENLNKLFDEEVLKDYYEGPPKRKVERYHKLLKSLTQADVVILEVSEHSLSMGYWLQKALDLNKPVIALYLEGQESSFLSCIKSEKLQVLEHEEENLDEVLAKALKTASGSQDTRFNFFISPRHQNYLDWISKNRKLPRSVFLRRLIDDHMRKNSDYNS